MGKIVRFVRDRATGEEIPVRTAAPVRSRSAPPHHYFPFLPLDSMPALTRAGPYAVPVFLAVLYFWKVRKLRPVKTGRKFEQLIGLKRWAVAAAMKRLEREGLVALTYESGRALWVTPTKYADRRGEKR